MGLPILFNQAPPPPPARIYPRNLLGSLRAALTDTPVVVLNGARQTGKSTLAAQLIRDGHRATYVTLDDATTLAGARADPDGFISGFSGSAVIDEVQRAPDLFRAIKATVDRDRRAGRFLLTGSAAVLLVPAISESLTGRTEILTLWPLSQGELGERKETFIDRVFGHRLPRVDEPRAITGDVIERVLRGGYPEVVRRSDTARRSTWFRSYVTTMLERDVRNLSEIERLTDMPRLLSLLAARTASLLNMADLSRVSGLPHRTLIRYMALLETTFLARRIPAWAGALGSRLVRHPKAILTDAGLAGSLQGLVASRFARDPTLAGPLLETFVAMELVKQAGWNESGASLHHLRSHGGVEVDLVLEHPDGRLVGIEVKATTAVGTADLKGLRELAARQQRKFHRGVVLYTGSQTVHFGDRLVAMPVSALWSL